MRVRRSVAKPGSCRGSMRRPLPCPRVLGLQPRRDCVPGKRRDRPLARGRGHLVSPIAAFKRDILIKLRQRFAKDRSGRGSGWIFEYDAGSPDVLKGVAPEAARVA